MYASEHTIPLIRYVVGLFIGDLILFHIYLVQFGFNALPIPEIELAFSSFRLKRIQTLFRLAYFEVKLDFH